MTPEERQEMFQLFRKNQTTALTDVEVFRVEELKGLAYVEKAELRTLYKKTGGGHNQLNGS